MKASLKSVIICCISVWGSTEAFSHGAALISMSSSGSKQFGVSRQEAADHIALSRINQGQCMLKMAITNEDRNIIEVKNGKRISRFKWRAGVGVFLYTLLSSKAAVAKSAASVVSTAASPVILPPMHKILFACLIPTLLGFYKSEYGVSYGYGTAMAASSYLILDSISQSAGLPIALSFTSTKPSVVLKSLVVTMNSLKTLIPTSLPAFHAFAVFFYGSRLNLFLLYRELCLPRFRAMRERIEERAKKQGGRLMRTPFLLSCTFLYFCMICPVLVTTKLCQGISMSCGDGEHLLLGVSLRSSVVLSFLGYLLGAIGDLNKSIGKMIKGEDTLITGGVFRYFRHPNYTGEMIGWTSNCAAAFLAVALKAVTTDIKGGLHVWKSMAGLLSLSVIGTIGIAFVLGTATAGLELRQREKYGDTDEYEQWIQKSWVGFKMGRQKKDEDDSTQDAAK